MPQHIHTPIIYSHPLSERTKKEVYLKLESLQPTGSYKDRGIGFLCDHYAQKNHKGFISSSGGNAGLAVAFAGKRLNLPTIVVIPESTSKRMIEKIKNFGAQVIVHGQHWNEADELAHQLVQEKKLNYIHPFDHPVIWQGHQTIVDEIHKDLGQPDAILLSVGGGGLFTGLMQGLEKYDWSTVSMITAETEGAASFAKSYKLKKLTTLDKIETIATTLGAKQVAKQAFEWGQKVKLYPQVMSDKTAVNACLKFADEHRILVEPSCGATLSVLYENSDVLERFKKICVIICGGSGVSIDLLVKWREQFGLS